MQEDLAAMGQKLEDSNFYAIVMGSSPSSYNPYILAINATLSVLETTLTADDLMLIVTKEFERHTLQLIWKLMRIVRFFSQSMNFLFGDALLIIANLVT